MLARACNNHSRLSGITMHLVHLPAGRGMSHTLRESMPTWSNDWMYMCTLCMYIHVSLNHCLFQGNGSIYMYTVVGS